MKKQDFFNNLADAIRRTNCPHMALPGNVSNELFEEIGMNFSKSTLIMFHNTQIGHSDMLVCFDENDNVLAVKVGSPTQSFMFALNLTQLLYGAKIKYYEQSKIDSNKLIIKLA